MEAPRIDPASHQISDLAGIAPEIGNRLQLTTLSAGRVARQERKRLQSIESLLLGAAATAQSVVLVLDDLHQTGGKSFLLCRVLSGAPGDPPSVVLRDRRESATGGDAAKVAGENVFRREGDCWTIGNLAGASILRDAKGLHYIAHLLRHAGKECHVAELGGPVGLDPDAREHARRSAVRGRVTDDVTLGLGDAGDVLDGQARATYQRRVEDLRSELDQATEWGDTERATRLREEIDFITRELSAAYGLGGRPRKAADANERIRKSVTNRIRDSIAKIAKHRPELGAHLSRSISMGLFCSYTPEHPVHWSL